MLYDDKLIILCLFKLEKLGGLKPLFSVTVSPDLTFQIHVNGKLMPSRFVDHLTSGNKITDACTLTNIIAFSKTESGEGAEHHIELENLIELLADTVEANSKLDEPTTAKLLFLIEQLKLTLQSRHSHR